MFMACRFVLIGFLFTISSYAEINLTKSIYEAAEEMMLFDEKMNQAIAKHNGFDESDDYEMRLHDLVNDFEEIEDGYRLEHEVEDVKNSKVHVDVKDGVLTVKTTMIDKAFMNFDENSSYSTTMSAYSFSLFVPNDADIERMEESYVNGILKIIFPKKID